jgi:hypothetical protein
MATQGTPLDTPGPAIEPAKPVAGIGGTGSYDINKKIDAEQRRNANPGVVSK